MSHTTFTTHGHTVTVTGPKAGELAAKVADAIAPKTLPPITVDKIETSQENAGMTLMVGEQFIPVLIGSYSAST